MHFESATAQLIAAHAQGLAAHAMNLSSTLRPDSGPAKLAERDRYVADATLHLRSLSDAILGASEQLFVDYVDWARTAHAARNVDACHLTEQLSSLRTVLKEKLPEAAPSADTFLSAAFARLAAPPGELVCGIAPGSLAARYLERLLAYDRNGAMAEVSRALESGVALRDVYLDVIQSVQHELGRLWQLNTISVAQEHYCTAVSQLVLAQLYPQMMHGPGGPRMVATCVSDELHELGARMVADFFEMDGWDSTYVGANAPPGDVLQLLRKRPAPLLAISATMGCHLHGVLELIEQVRAAPDLRHMKILVGGRPFAVEGTLWVRLGADGCASDAQEAVLVGRRLLQEASR